MNAPIPRPSLRSAGLVLGLGLGGFFDGIVCHQILGWHHMVCTTFTCQPDSVAALRVQITQDGYFHLVVWLLTIAGIGLLFRVARRQALAGQGRALLGAVLAGWGVFNVVEGLIDHHLLRLHHVRPGHPHELLFDLLFLVFGLVLIGLGGLIANNRGIHTTGNNP